MSIETYILNCYHLAHFYHVDPQIFLEKPIMEIGRHVHWTNTLRERIAEAEEAAQRSER